MSESPSSIALAYRRAVDEAKSKVEIVRSTQEPDDCPLCGIPSCEGDCTPPAVRPLDIISETGEVSQVAPVARKEVKMQNQVKSTWALPEGTAKMVVYSSYGVIITDSEGQEKQAYCPDPYAAAVAAKGLGGIAVSSKKDARGVPWLVRLAPSS